MYIAIEKRRENIAEYILYLWQMEDMLRALQFSPEAIFSQLVAPRGGDAESQHQLLSWYMELGGLMHKEGKEKTGHLDHTMHLIADLQNLHLQLMQLQAGERYRKLFAVLEPELPGLRAVISHSDTLGDNEVSDIELCFRALYAALLYRIKGDEKSLKTADEVVEVVSPAIAELASVYRKAEQGEIDLFGNKEQQPL